MKKLTNWINKHNEDGGLYYGIIIGAISWILFMFAGYLYSL